MSLTSGSPSSPPMAPTVARPVGTCRPQDDGREGAVLLHRRRGYPGHNFVAHSQPTRAVAVPWAPLSSVGIRLIGTLTRSAALLQYLSSYSTNARHCTQ